MGAGANRLIQTLPQGGCGQHRGSEARGPETPELKSSFFPGVFHSLCCSAPPRESPVHSEVLKTSSRVFFQKPCGIKFSVEVLTPSR